MLSGYTAKSCEREQKYVTESHNPFFTALLFMPFTSQPKDMQRC
jgi:hypothetical protein